MSDSNNNRGGPLISLPVLVFGVFLTLKLAEIGQVATWSWWWVTAPLWIPAGLAIIFMIGFFCLFIIAAMVAKKKAEKTKIQVEEMMKGKFDNLFEDEV